MNKFLKRTITFCYYVGILLVFVGILELDTSNQNLARILIIIGAFLCLLFHFVSYKRDMKNKDIIDNQTAFLRFAGILIMLVLAFLKLFLWQRS
jgi:uncharacterized membrane protein YidH (DUF202 family)